MNGWQVMAAPLAVVVRMGALVATMVALGWLTRRAARGAPPPSATPVVRRLTPRGWTGPERESASGRRTAPDSSVLAAYDQALLDGWPPR